MYIEKDGKKTKNILSYMLEKAGIVGGAWRWALDFIYPILLYRLDYVTIKIFYVNINQSSI